MNVGDKVRMLHGREQGIITRILANDLIEIAIDNDFTIPVSRREVVVIAAEEEKVFAQTDEPAPKTRQQFAAHIAGAIAAGGIYMAFVHQTPELLALHLVNNSGTDVLFTFGEKRKGTYKALASGKITTRQTAMVGHYHLTDFETWPEFNLQWLQHANGADKQFLPSETSVSFKAATFYKAKKQTPLLKQPGFVFELDARSSTIDPEKLKEQLSDGAKNPESGKLTPPLPEVDLHIQELTSEYETMDSASILMMQLQTFETALDRAIAAGMHEITFIHGAGNGILRKEIQKRLSNFQKQKQIKFYEDARREKFGYGATKVKII